MSNPSDGPLALKPRQKRVSERAVEAESKRWARNDGWYVRKFTSPGQRAVPDDVFLKGSVVWFIEFKKPGEKPTEAQWQEIMEIRAHGGNADWSDNLERTKAILGGHAPVSTPNG